MMNHQTTFETLVDVLQARASSRQSITFIAGQGDYHRVEFAELYGRAVKRLASFQSKGLAAGHFMIIQSSDNAFFLEALWACFLGGIVAVPVAGGNSREHKLKLFRIVKTLDNPAIFTDEKNLQRVQQFASENQLTDQFEPLHARCCLIEEDIAIEAEPIMASPGPADTAFIQFSSGSTSTPKGIVLSHSNIVTNTGSIIDGCQMRPDDHLLSWMPLTHDMGLIGFHLTPLVCNTSHSLIPTDLFVRRPAIWLVETQRQKGTILCSPNFGYQHLLKSFKPDNNTGLDLSSVRLLFNGAEPISVSLCEDFMEAMAPFALDRDAMIPVYGLAEASLAVTFPALEKRFSTLLLDRASLAVGGTVRILDDAEDGVRYVSVGRPVTQVELTIRGEDGADCEERVTGRICIRGKNVTSGYFNEPALNAMTIDADGWLDTGDLGFRHDEQLYITGRAKDIIFVNGLNVYPHDLEEIIIQKDLVERGKLAVASHSDDEQLVVFVVHRSDISELESLAREITRTLGHEAGVRVDVVAAVARLPKTTSGKVQRFQLVQEYQAGKYQTLSPEPAEEALLTDENAADSSEDASDASDESKDASTASRLLAICNSCVEGMIIALGDNLFELGISSLTLAEIHASIEEAWPDQVEITDLFDYPTVAELAEFLDEKAG